MAPCDRSADRRLLLAVLFAAALLRALQPLWLGSGTYDAVFAPPETDPVYRRALTEHFLEYLRYEHTLPVFFTLKNALLHALFPADQIRPVSYGIVAVFGVAATGLAFATMRRLAVNVWIAGAVTLVVSLRLAMWEVWQWGEGWDSWNPFVVLLFAWAMVAFADRSSARRAWALAGAAAAVVGNFQFGIPAVVAGGVVLVLAMMPAAGLAAHAARIASLPVLFGLAMVAKNGLEHGLWSPSSGAGQNIVQNLNMALVDADGRGALTLARRNGYPPWWIWCYEEAERRGVHPTPNVAGFYGACMFTPDGRLDFSDLERYVLENPDSSVRGTLSQDLEIARDRPWLWSGPVRFRATGVSIDYGKISRRLFGDILREAPRGVLGRAYDNLTQHFLGVGGRLFVSVELPASAAVPLAVKRLNGAGTWLFWVGFAFAAAAVPIVAAWRILVWAGRAPAPGPIASASAALSSMVVAIALISAFLACCENYRHAFVVLPVTLVLAAAALQFLLRSARRITVNR